MNTEYEKNDELNPSDPVEATEQVEPVVTESSPYIYKKEEKQNLPGWLKFFIFTAGLGMVVTFFTYFLTFNIEDYSFIIFPSLTIVGVALDALFVFGLVGFGIYMIYSFVQRNPNAPTYGILYCCLLLFSHFIQLFGGIAGDGFDSSSDFRGLAQTVRGIFWCIIWIAYFVCSSRIGEVYPKEKRKIPQKVIAIVVGIAFCPVLLLILGIFDGILQEL